MPVLVPYDGSDMAGAVLQHLAGTSTGIARRHGRPIVLIVPAASRCAVRRLLVRARTLATSVRIGLRLLDCAAADALTALASAVPRSTFVVSLDLDRAGAWYYGIAQTLLTGRCGACIAVDALPRARVPRRDPQRRTPAAIAERDGRMHGSARGQRAAGCTLRAAGAAARRHCPLWPSAPRQRLEERQP